MTPSSVRPRRLSLSLAAFLVLGAGAVWLVGARMAAAGGFAEPVEVLPEIGLWADGFTELSYGRDPGLVILWGLDTTSATGQGRLASFDWSQVAFRVRAELFNAEGRRVKSEERIVDPPHLEDGLPRGGFPITLRLLLRESGTYRARLEAYPLVAAEEAGLDSVPRRVIEAEAVLEKHAPTGADWQVSDLLLLRGFQPWRAGSAPERTWHEWVLDPAVSRRISPDSAGSYLAFEVQRGEEPVPHCLRTNCRVTITIYDAAGGLSLQTLRPVPKPFSVSAYLVPIETMALPPGEYEARVEVFEANEKLAAQARRFLVREPEAEGPAEPAPEGAPSGQGTR